MAKDLGLPVDEEVDFEKIENGQRNTSIAKVLFKTESF